MRCVAVKSLSWLGNIVRADQIKVLRIRFCRAYSSTLFVSAANQRRRVDGLLVRQRLRRYRGFNHFYC